MNYPSSTYRIQLHSKFTFKDLAAIVDYLHDLGISTIYASPITAAEKDSMHGYDVTDAGKINPQIGNLEEFDAITKTLKKYGMTWLQDIVPNHMAFSTANGKLMDVLERGQFSPYYKYFDIYWEHPDLNEQLQIPVLGKELKISIQDKDISLSFETDGFKVNCNNTLFPLSVSAWSVLTTAMKSSVVAEELIENLEKLGTDAYHSSLEEWLRLKEKVIRHIHKQEVWLKDISAFLKKCNGNVELLHKILEAQAYRLAHWKTSENQMNYRRFFTINSLICLSMENEGVFTDYHEFIAKLYHNGSIQGVRIDHIDGLYDPKAYVQRLRQLLGRDCYVIAEKILEYDEPLPSDWDLAGTSGYEFLAYTNRVLTNQEGADQLKAFYESFTELHKNYEDLIFEKKRAFLYSQMRGELQNLMQLLSDLKIVDNPTDEHALKKALATFMASFPVYRIYPEQFPLSDESLLLVHKAIDTAQHKESGLDKEFGIIKSLFDEVGLIDPEKKLSFIKRLMQFTGPLAAKGVEDTTFYVHNPLISHNEVGDSPGVLSVTVEAFHQKMLARQLHTPYSLNASSTHDTKRGEDARMRINALSVLHEEWIELVKSWHEGNRAFIKVLDQKAAPSLNDEYFIYQSLLGGFPEDFKIDESFHERMKAFITKSLREAKVNTTYTEPNEAYETATIEFAVSILDSKHSFLQSFIPFLEKVINYASHYSLAQTVLKITAPGVPDFYQGTELQDLSFVDPDNRRPIDYQFRRQALADIKLKEAESIDLALSFIKERKTEGFEKLYATYKLLPLRKELNYLFSSGAYKPVYPALASRKVISFMRSFRDDHIWVIIPLDVDKEGLEGIKLEVPEGLPALWTNVFTGGSFSFGKAQALSLHTILAGFPVAVLRG